MRCLLRLPVSAAVLLVVVALTMPAYADTQGVTNCSGCNGYAFSATLTPTGVDPGTGATVYDLKYTVTNVGGSAAYVYNWSLTLFNSGNTVSSANLNGITLNGTTNVPLTDYTSLAGKSNNGNSNCNQTLGNAICVEPKVSDANLPKLASVNDSITFDLTLECLHCNELANWILLSSGDCVANTNANCYAISTQTTANVPEPSVMMLLGASGLFGLCTFVRNKLRV